jgi:hypothetical protein
MKSDTVKLIATYALAFTIVVAGFLVLYLTRLDPPEADVQGLRLVVAGFMGSAVTWTFGHETATSAARQVEHATAAGASSATPGGPPVVPLGTLTLALVSIAGVIAGVA